MSILTRLFTRAADPRETMRPTWNAIVAAARAPHWYQGGGVPDTLDGRFDMVALVMTLVLHRVDDDPAHVRDGVFLTELFVADMDGQLRQIGFGDMVVGKQIGRVMSALGGRLGAYRAADGTAELRAALVRNVWRGTVPTDAAMAHVERAVARLRSALAAMPVAILVASDHLPDGSAA